MTREPFEMIEIDLPQCARTYATAPCAAVLGTTGVRKCYNTRATCQDTANFALGSPKTLRFCRPGPIPSSTLAFPVLASVNMSSSSVNIVGSADQSGGLGRRATLDFKIDDFTYHERGVDPYQAGRVDGTAQTDEPGYKPESRGTFLAKLKARWPNYDQANVRLVRGYLVNGALTDITTWHYFLSKMDGPSDGVLNGSAVDVFSAYLDPKKALAPKPSIGVLAHDISNTDFTFTITPAGSGATYPSTVFVCIGSEVMACSRSGDTFTAGRGSRGTKASSHSAGDAVQEVLAFRSTRMDAVINSLLTAYTSTPVGYIDLGFWQSEIQRWAPSTYLTTDICQPTPVSDLLGELSSLGCNIFADERTQKIKVRMNRPLDGETFFVATDRSMKAIKQEDRDEDRITQVLFHTKRADPTKQLTDESNYVRKMLTVNPDAVALFGAAKMRKIFCRWLDDADDTTVAVMSWRILRRFERAPKKVTVTIDARDKAITVFDVIEVASDDLCDESGKPVVRQFQVVRRKEPIGYHDIEVETQAFVYEGRYGYISPNSQPAYGSASAAQRARYGFIVDEGTMLFPGGATPYRFI